MLLHGPREVLLAKYYGFIFMVKAHSDFGRRVLRLAGSSDKWAGTGSLSGLCIPKRVDIHLMFPQAVLHMTPVTALPDGVFCNF